MQKITPYLWFDTQLEEAMKFYTSVFKNSEIVDMQSGPDGKPFTGKFVLDGVEFMAMNAGPYFKFNEAISLYIKCKDQAEVDYFWEKLTADGGEESQCGWVKDKFGVSWQVIPDALPEYVAGSDPEGAQRAMQAMLKMRKIIVEDLKKAYEGK
jgi:predicted 3-demethylubiquinone-9 3-methyltransferase (glyoxalase superfamily)